MEKKKKVSFAMFLVTIGIVYGDIGTSPMYVMKSILEGNGGIAHVDEAFIVGSLSLVIWTITLLTTFKYVLIAMKADNHGEGGIFSLYALVKDCGKWLIVPAMLGGAALLADGLLTPGRHGDDGCRGSAQHRAHGSLPRGGAEQSRHHYAQHHFAALCRAARRHQ